MQFLTPEEILRILKVARQHSQRDHLMILMAYSHGLRATEVCQIRLADISNGSLTIRRLKNSKTTVQPLVPHRGQPLLDEIKSLRDYTKVRLVDAGEYLFPSLKGGCLKRNAFNVLFARYCVLAGIPEGKRNPHILKHSAANHLVRAGVDIAYVQARLGHASIGSTMRYVSLNDEEVATKTHSALMDVF